MKQPFPELCAARFEPIEPIARGGFSTVWLARQIDLNRSVVVKILHGEMLTDPDLVRRFGEEARMTASIVHPNVVVVIDHGVEGGVPWIVYERLMGRSLRDEIAAGSRPWKDAFGIVCQVAAGLEAAHEKGILHRDIKPENVLEAEPGWYKLADFGIAKWARSRGVKTQDGVVMGTPAYISPEQITGEEVKEQADIYSLGIVAYELITGQVPFRAGPGENPFLAHLKYEPLRPSDAVDVPRAVDRVILKALSKQAADRYSCARAFRQALEELTQPVEETEVKSRPSRKEATLESYAVGISREQLLQEAAAARQPRPAEPKPVRRPTLRSGRVQITKIGRPSREIAHLPSRRVHLRIVASVGAAILVAGALAFALRAPGPRPSPPVRSIAVSPRAAGSPSPRHALGPNTLRNQLADARGQLESRLRLAQIYRGSWETFAITSKAEEDAASGLLGDYPIPKTATVRRNISEADGRKLIEGFKQDLERLGGLGDAARVLRGDATLDQAEIAHLAAQVETCRFVAWAGLERQRTLFDRVRSIDSSKRLSVSQTLQIVSLSYTYGAGGIAYLQALLEAQLGAVKQLVSQETVDPYKLEETIAAALAVDHVFAQGNPAPGCVQRYREQVKAFLGGLPGSSAQKVGLLVTFVGHLWRCQSSLYRPAIPMSVPPADLERLVAAFPELGKTRKLKEWQYQLKRSLSMPPPGR